MKSENDMEQHPPLAGLPPLPDEIARLVRDKNFRRDDIGRSSSSVLLFEDAVLKIEQTGENAEREYKMLAWLSGKLPVPEILAFARGNGKNYLLMSRLFGEMACADRCLARPMETVRALADGLKQLWRVDISGCPSRNGLNEKLKAAQYNIDHGLVDMDDLNDGTLGPGGFRDIPELFDFLLENRSEEEFALSHGDYCLPNVFVSGGRTVGFLDLGNAGVADKWQDIALCLRSLVYNFQTIGHMDAAAMDAYRRAFFREIDMEPDEDKIRYFILLDELF